MPIAHEREIPLTHELHAESKIGIESDRSERRIAVATRIQARRSSDVGTSASRRPISISSRGYDGSAAYGARTSRRRALRAATRWRDFGVSEFIRRVRHRLRAPAHLKSVVWAPRSRNRGLSEAREVTTFDLWHTKPKAKSFEGREVPSTVEVATMNWANPLGPSGLPRLPRRRRLGSHRCRNSCSLAGLDTVAPMLEELFLTRLAERPSGMRRRPYRTCGSCG
jgi:hypothetical protein